MIKVDPRAPRTTQNHMLQQLSRNKSGLTIGELVEELNISRNAVRQHLAALENEGVVSKGETNPTGGRPEQLYILAEEGRERFPRQYSWFAELLLQSLQDKADKGTLDKTLAALGRQVGASLQAQLPGKAGSARQITALAESMTGLGYDATATSKSGETFIEAYNCVFHKLAETNPSVCKFDLALLSESTGCAVEHRSCMVRGDDCCRFYFQTRKTR